MKEEKMCMCGHKEKEHTEQAAGCAVKLERGEPLIRLHCLVKGCKCGRFTPIDEEDQEFMETLE